LLRGKLSLSRTVAELTTTHGADFCQFSNEPTRSATTTQPIKQKNQTDTSKVLDESEVHYATDEQCDKTPLWLKIQVFPDDTGFRISSLEIVTETRKLDVQQ